MKKNVVRAAAAIIAACIISAPSYCGDVNSSAMYKSIRINEGDTLWSIAREYAPSGMPVNEYIKQIKEINHCGDLIREGAYLLIPYEFPIENML